VGFGIGLNSLWHSHASQLLRAGAPATAVAARLGQRVGAPTLSAYVRAIEEAEQRAADTAAIVRDVLGPVS
jgi:hypothetical protein